MKSGQPVTLPCHLSANTSADAMKVRWFKRSECIYLYQSGVEMKAKGWEDRLTLNTKELQYGNLSLTLAEFRGNDAGVYVCQVQHGEQQTQTEAAVGLSSSRE